MNHVHPSLPNSTHVYIPVSASHAHGQACSLTGHLFPKQPGPTSDNLLSRMCFGNMCKVHPCTPGDTWSRRVHVSPCERRGSPPEFTRQRYGQTPMHSDSPKHSQTLEGSDDGWRLEAEAATRRWENVLGSGENRFHGIKGRCGPIG